MIFTAHGSKNARCKTIRFQSTVSDFCRPTLTYELYCVFCFRLMINMSPNIVCRRSVVTCDNSARVIKSNKGRDFFILNYFGFYTRTDAFQKRDFNEWRVKFYFSEKKKKLRSIQRSTLNEYSPLCYVAVFMTCIALIMLFTNKTSSCGINPCFYTNAFVPVWFGSFNVETGGVC